MLNLFPTRERRQMSFTFLFMLCLALPISKCLLHWNVLCLSVSLIILTILFLSCFLWLSSYVKISPVDSDEIEASVVEASGRGGGCSLGWAGLR